MLKQRKNKLIVLAAVADCQLESHDHRALERQDLERLAPLAGRGRLRCYRPRPAMTTALCETRASRSLVWRFALVYQGAGKLARRKDSRHGESIPNDGPARVAGHAGRNCDHGSGAVGLRQLASGEHLTGGEQLTTGEQFNVGEQPGACQHGLAQSRTNHVAPSAGLRQAGAAGGRQTCGLVEGVLGSKGTKVAAGRSRNRDLVQEPRPRKHIRGDLHNPNPARAVGFQREDPA
jgi:hypothetical protein